MGPVGPFLAISLLLNVYLFKKYDGEKDKRNEDGKGYLTATLGPLKQVVDGQESQQKSIDLLTQVVQEKKGLK